MRNEIFQLTYLSGERGLKMENQVKLLETIHDRFESYKRLIPDVGGAYDQLPAEVYKGGALEGKAKRLMALCAALTHGCTACIYSPDTCNARRKGTVTAETVLIEFYT